ERLDLVEAREQVADARDFLREVLLEQRGALPLALRLLVPEGDAREPDGLGCVPLLDGVVELPRDLLRRRGREASLVAAGGGDEEHRGRQEQEPLLVHQTASPGSKLAASARPSAVQ